MKLTDDQLEAIAKEAFPYRINEESDVTHADMRKVALAVAAKVRMTLMIRRAATRLRLLQPTSQNLTILFRFET